MTNDKSIAICTGHVLFLSGLDNEKLESFTRVIIDFEV